MTKRDNDDNDAEWSALGYPKEMGSAKFGLPPPDHSLVRAYHLTSAEHGISSISLNRLKVSCFSEVNDPFELKALNSHKREIRELLRRMDSEVRNTGLLCFSANWTNPLLWSHYASNHKGICLGFDLKRSEVQCVVYKRKRQRLRSSSDADPLSISSVRNLLLRTKFIGWKYEQECRRFVDLSKAKQEGKLHFSPFDEGLCLKEVILGERNDLCLEAIRTLTKATNPGAVVFKTRLERRGFRIVGDGDYPPQIPNGAANDWLAADAAIASSS